ncbi:hypothetical protein FOXG_16043 [Fusarium oxysporum f. sp. lycopersici 4287]|uniref:C2H2-type domain-containing protein n=1 Tax=Fusarium oxysporum f. sp. lycopersici (strain 4287 / CBS 123668 / FGSC 9935 / NRRL 34936) TaxID=426428 RepID=A0A0J9WUT9_FUSO4|nr:uncharacterized protein FOXG_16043 [Fusarium oxysporum f. sp. lycopersici 4287]KNB18362.1 hypothetical protein FOXG_16043 [Fusarium oxysporum f. sp. lycopersici 4287]
MEPARQVSTQLSPGKFECSWEACTKSFNSKAGFTRHYRIHTGEKPYRCSIDGCTKKFARNDTLKRHQRTHPQEITSLGQSTPSYITQQVNPGVASIASPLPTQYKPPQPSEYHQPEELPRYAQPAFSERGDPENTFASNELPSTGKQKAHSLRHDRSSNNRALQRHQQFVQGRFAIFFEQWSPFFPVLHEPTAFRTYREFENSSGNTKNKHTIAQIYLIVDIAGLSCHAPDLQQHLICKKKWQEALNAIAFDKGVLTLQCLVLAILCCIIRADDKQIAYYKHIAVNLSNDLGLHTNQGDIRLDTLTNETRKRIFWTLYMLDCFSASRLNTPMLLKDTEIKIDYPGDIDGEYITEHGYLNTPSWKPSRISCALALFRAARVLAKALNERYYDVNEFTSERMTAIEGELDAWLIQIPRHLELDFTKEVETYDRRSIRPWIERQIRESEGYSYRCRMNLDQNIFPFDDFEANSSTGALVFVPGRRCNIFVTPLSAATYLGNVTAVKYFLQFPDPHEDNGLVSPLSLACLQGHSHVIPLLAERNESGNTLNTAHMAARTGRSHFIQHLYHKFHLQGACDIDSIPPAVHALYLEDDEQIKEVFSVFIDLDRDALDTLGDWEYHWKCADLARAMGKSNDLVAWLEDKCRSLTG